MIGKSVVSGKVEIDSTESFEKHKRNLLLASSISIIFWIASPQKIKMPGLGTDVSLNSNVAFALIALSILYFFLSFAISYNVIWLRNSRAVAEAGLGTIDVRLDKIGKNLEARAVNLQNLYQDATDQITQTQDYIGQALQEAGVSEYKNGFLKKVIGTTVLSSYASKNLYENPQIDEFINERFSDFLDSINFKISSAVSTTTATYAQIIPTINQITELTTLLKNDQAELLQNFRRLSGNIITSSRWGLIIIDGVIPAMTAAIAFGLGVSRALH